MSNPTNPWQRTGERGIYRRADTNTPWLVARYMVNGKPRAVTVPCTKASDAAKLRKRLIQAEKLYGFDAVGRLLKGQFNPEAATPAPPAGPTIAKILETYLATTGISSAKKNANALRAVLREAGVSNPDAASWQVLNAETGAAYRRAATAAAKAEKDLLKRGRYLRSKQSRLRQARSVLAKHCLPEYRALGMGDVAGFFEGTIQAPTKVYQVPPAEILRTIAADFPALEKSDPDLFAGFLVGLGIGLRNKEAAGARHDWFEQDTRGLWFLRMTTHADSETKTKRARWIEVQPAVHAALTRVQGRTVTRERPSENGRSLQAIDSEQEYLIPGTSWTDRYNTLTRRLSSWLRVRGLDKERYTKTYYELRKLFTTELAKRNKSITIAAQAAGNQPTTAERYYIGAINGPDPVDVLASLAADPALPA